jgi:hypothetical protein
MAMNLQYAHDAYKEDKFEEGMHFLKIALCILTTSDSERGTSEMHQRSLIH